MDQSLSHRIRTSVTLAAGIFLGTGCDTDPRPASAGTQALSTSLDVKTPELSSNPDRWRAYPAVVADTLATSEAYSNGERVALSQASVKVLVFAESSCPMVARYVEKLNELQEKFSSRLSLQIVGVFPKADESVQSINSFAAEYKAAFPVMLDAGAKLADALHAERSPEVFIFNGQNELIYRGSIDDSQRVGAANPVVRNDFLHDVLESVAEERPLSTSLTDVDGCYLDRPTLSDIYPTWTRDIGPLVEKHCAVCHTEGEIGQIKTFSSGTEVRNSLTTMLERIEDGSMPPWRATGERDRFEHDRRLDVNERWAFQAWARKNMPEGEGTYPIDPKRHASARHLQDFDMVVEMLDPNGEKPMYTVPANGVVPYQTFIAPMTFDEDKWLIASEVTTPSPRSVHHISVFLIPPNEDNRYALLKGNPLARGLAAKRFGILPSEYDNVLRFYGMNLTRQVNLIGFYAPGEGCMNLDPRHGVLIPKGSQIAFEVHYTAIGKEAQDRSSIALKFGEMPADAEGSRVITRTAAPRMAQIQIEPGQQQTIVKMLPIFADADLYGLRPHMHLRGREYRCEVIRPGEKPETIIHIPAWDYNWERHYVLKEPVSLPKGSALRITYNWDNSEQNLDNPDPTKKVTFGTSLFHEMGLSWLSLIYRNAAETEDAEIQLQEVLDGVIPNPADALNTEANTAQGK